MTDNTSAMPDFKSDVVAGMAPVRSMTGFAQQRRATEIGELTISLRSVNGRSLDVHLHLPFEFAPYENGARALLKKRILRGHIEVRGGLTRDPESETLIYNREFVQRYVSQFEQARVDFGLDSKIDLNAVFALPGAFEPVRDAKTLNGSFEAEFFRALEQCIAELNAFREREGHELLKAITAEADRIDTAAEQIRAIRSDAQHHFETRLRDRLRELLSSAAISEARLTEEAALLADRSDIQEELTRLTVHTRELRRMIAVGGEIGKKLDFLLQELNRETNTTLSKTSGIGEAGLTITALALGIKANIERIREQALNLE